MVQATPQASPAQAPSPQFDMKISMSLEDLEMVKEAARFHLGLREHTEPDLKKYFRTLIEEDIIRIVESIKAREASGE